jgi:hypothetical protein
MDNSFRKWPEIAETYVTYVQCRKQDLVRIEKAKSKGSEVSLIPRTNGYNNFPWEGGLLDQPYRMFVFFDAFQAAEAEVFAEKVK